MIYGTDSRALDANKGEIIKHHWPRGWPGRQARLKRSVNYSVICVADEQTVQEY